MMRFGWKGENLAVRISDWAWKMYSGLSCMCMFQTWTNPSGSWGAEGFFV